MFEQMTGLGCTVTILLLADLDNMSLDYLYYDENEVKSEGYAE